jgi:uncharacterized protein involved in exopolysaccharide biosynthesis
MNLQRDSVCSFAAISPCRRRSRRAARSRAAHAGSGGQDQPLFRLNLLRALQLHRRLALGIASGRSAAGLAYVVKAWPVYTAQSQIYVQPVQSKVMASGNDSELPINSAAYDSFVQQQVQSASNPDVLMSALGTS